MDAPKTIHALRGLVYEALKSIDAQYPDRAIDTRQELMHRDLVARLMIWFDYHLMGLRGTPEERRLRHVQYFREQISELEEFSLFDFFGGDALPQLLIGLESLPEELQQVMSLTNQLMHAAMLNQVDSYASYWSALCAMFSSTGTAQGGSDFGSQAKPAMKPPLDLTKLHVWTILKGPPRNERKAIPNFLSSRKRRQS